MSDKEQRKDIKLQIEFVAKTPLLKFFWKKKRVIQAKPFKPGLVVKNIGATASPELTIKKLTITSSDGGKIKYNVFGELCVERLGSGTSKEILWPSATTIIAKGKTWVECEIVPQNQEYTIQAHQFNKVSKRPTPCRAQNKWKAPLLVRGELESQQASTNLLILILTALVFLDGVWGLGAIFKEAVGILGFIVRLIESLFGFIGALISKIPV